MPSSPYVRGLRRRIGHSLLLLPCVTAVILDGERVLLARQRDTGLWSLIGGSVEPGEDPRDAVLREIREELGVTAAIDRVLGAYGGPDLTDRLPNGDVVAYVTTAYVCRVAAEPFRLERAELIEARWFDLAAVDGLERHRWISRVLADLVPARPRTDERGDAASGSVS